MARVIGYHRPASLDEVLTLIGQPGPARVIVGGGTSVNARAGIDPVEIVDLQRLQLDSIEKAGDRLEVGATVTLQALADDERVPQGVRDLAVRELPSTLRTLATIGGLVASGDPESELLAAMLVHDARVHMASTDGTEELALADVLDAGVGNTIITGVSIEMDGSLAVARTGRTPGDRPIVAAVARRRLGAGDVAVAMCGVAGVPVLVVDPGDLDPVGDFRGSSEYRIHVARVLFERVKAEVG